MPPAAQSLAIRGQADLMAVELEQAARVIALRGGAGRRQSSRTGPLMPVAVGVRCCAMRVVAPGVLLRGRPRWPGSWATSDWPASIPSIAGDVAAELVQFEHVVELIARPLRTPAVAW